VPVDHLEIETKFDVPVPYAVPELAGVDGVASADAPVEHRLEAQYFDTADLRLARARITLRRRTGGPDDGWHVKLPVSGDARQELRHPLGRATRRPPRAVVAPLLGVLRGAAPVAVAQLRTRRVVTVLRDADGRPLAEVADDAVSATRLSGPDGAAGVRSWREVEVELLEGDRDLLARVGEQLVAAGAARTARASKLARALGLEAEPPSAPASAEPRKKKGGKKRRDDGPSAGEAVLAVVREQVSALQLADVGLRTGADDGLRRMRIACRSLRATLAAFRPVLDRTATDPVRDELRWLAGALSEPRDDEVAFAGLRAAVAELPGELVLGPVVARLQSEEVAARELGRTRAAELVAGQRHLDLLDALHALLTDPPLTASAAEPAGPVLDEVLRREARLVRRSASAAEALEGTERTEALHAVRRVARRARHVAEAVPVVGERAGEVARAARRTQRLLGALQDVVVTGERCRQLAVSAHAAGEPGFTYGLLLGRAEARARDAELAFAERWPDLAQRLGG